MDVYILSRRNLRYKKLKEGRRFIVHPSIGILVLGMKWKVGNTITKSKCIHSN